MTLILSLVLDVLHGGALLAGLRLCDGGALAVVLRVALLLSAGAALLLERGLVRRLRHVLPPGPAVVSTVPSIVIAIVVVIEYRVDQPATIVVVVSPEKIEERGRAGLCGEEGGQQEEGAARHVAQLEHLPGLPGQQCLPPLYSRRGK